MILLLFRPSTGDQRMKHRNHSLFYLNLFLILAFTQAQESKNIALLPNFEECGQLKLEQFKNRTITAEVAEFPWMAQINYKDLRAPITTYRCLAVLISQRYLLTVAKCVEKTKRHEPNAVLLGDFSTTSDGSAAQLIGIEEIVIHPFFNPLSHSNDIALLRMNETISYTNYILPICLPSQEIKDKQFGAEQLTIAGWFRRQLLGNIHKLPVVINNIVDCRRKLSNDVNITESHMCGIACFQGFQYMPGSAIMDVVKTTSEPTNYYLAGLLSFIYERCMYPEEPNVFTRVDRYMDWIKENIYD